MRALFACTAALALVAPPALAHNTPCPLMMAPAAPVKAVAKPKAKPMAKADFASYEAFDGVVEKIVEADLLVVRPLGARAKLGPQQVFLLGSDTPEPGQGWWTTRAREHVAKLIGGKPVHVVLDRTPRAKCGYLKAFVHSKGGTFLNLALVEDGFAEVMSTGGNRSHDNALWRAQRRARAEGVGIWDRVAGLAVRPGAYRKAHGGDHHAGHAHPHGM